jgi:hypothetical protein
MWVAFAIFAVLFFVIVVYDAILHRELMAAICDLEGRVEELEVWRGTVGRTVEQKPFDPQWAALVKELRDVDDEGEKP